MVRDQLISGLTAGEIQQRILAKGDITLDDAIIFISGEESGKRSQQELSNDCIAAVSSYRKERRNTMKPKQCTHCGGNSHAANNTPADREQSCPAWGKQCKNCGIKHHFAKVCRKPKKPRDNSGSNQDERAQHIDAAVYEIGQGSDIKARTSPRKVSTDTSLPPEETLNHLSYNVEKDVWLTQSTSASPTVTVDASVCLRAYRQLGIFTEELRLAKAAVNLVAKADTGASVCVAGIDLMHAVGITQPALATTKVRLWSAENNMLQVLGAYSWIYASPAEKQAKQSRRGS